MKFQKLLLILLILSFNVGCGWIKGFGSDSSVVEVKDPADAKKHYSSDINPYVKPSTAEEMELKIARIWARIDELEDENQRQKEVIRVLQNGLMLGLVPEEIKDPILVVPTPRPQVETVAIPEEPKISDSEMSEEEKDAYQKVLAEAHSQFREGRYGRAIKLYSSIGDKFERKLTDGMHHYWIARSWANLKELNIAHQRYIEFMKAYPSSTWIPRAKLDKARVELSQGLRETAIRNFRDIIKEYPYEDVAEMAKMELERMENSL